MQALANELGQAMARGSGVDSESSDPFDYRHLKIVAPEILDALEGKLSLEVGEIAVHADFYKPSYPRELLDLLDWANHVSDNFLIAASANFSKPLYLPRFGVLIFNAVKISNPKNGGRFGKKAFEDFMERERRNFFSWHGGVAIPEELKLSYLMVIKTANKESTVAIASIAKPKTRQIG